MTSAPRPPRRRAKAKVYQPDDTEGGRSPKNQTSAPVRKHPWQLAVAALLLVAWLCFLLTMAWQP